MPFVMLLFGTISVCLFFFTTFTMENAVWQASRVIRTGQFQQGQGAYSGLRRPRIARKHSRQALCAKAPAYVDCNKAVVLVQSNSGGFGSITQPVCATDGTMIDEAKAEFNPGGASSVVLITVCYPWSFGGKLPFIAPQQHEGRIAAHPGLGRVPDGTVPIQLRHAPVAFGRETSRAPMSRMSTRTLVARTLDLVRCYRADKQGVAAIEFAFIVPIMFLMFVGAVELSQAITVDRRVTQAASSVADLGGAQGDVDLDNRDRRHHEDRWIHHGTLQPSSAAGDCAQRQLLVRRRHSNTKQSWQCTYSAVGANPTPACTCMNETYNLPPGLVTTTDSVVVAEVIYTYTPLDLRLFSQPHAAQRRGWSGNLHAQRKNLHEAARSGRHADAGQTDCPAHLRPSEGHAPRERTQIARTSR